MNVSFQCWTLRNSQVWEQFSAFRRSRIVGVFKKSLIVPNFPLTGSHYGWKLNQGADKEYISDLKILKEINLSGKNINVLPLQAFQGFNSSLVATDIIYILNSTWIWIWFWIMPPPPCSIWRKTNLGFGIQVYSNIFKYWILRGFVFGFKILTLPLHKEKKILDSVFKYIRIYLITEFNLNLSFWIN